MSSNLNAECTCPDVTGADSKGVEGNALVLVAPRVKGPLSGVQVFLPSKSASSKISSLFVLFRRGRPKKHHIGICCFAPGANYF